MTKPVPTDDRHGLVSPVALLLLACAALPAIAPAADLSRYRDFQLGSDLATVAKQTGTNPEEAKAIHRRPALIQELAWRPQPLGSPSQTEAAKDIVLTFYDGTLFRIVVSYDRYETEGLTTDDLVKAISATYGTAVKPAAAAKSPQALYGDQEEVLARWQDPQYRFDLVRSSYWPSFRLIAILKKLEEPAHIAATEAKRLDDQEAPQRDAARIALEDQATKDKAEKARLLNKPKFRP